MIGLVVFHIVIILLVLGIVSRVVPLQSVHTTLDYLHKTIGITSPRLEQTQIFALIWIGSTILIVDGSLFLLVFMTKVSS